MIEPTGPLPASIYWRRRLVAVFGSLIAVLLLVWVVGVLLGGNDSPAVRGTAQDDVAIPLASEPPSTSQAVSSSASVTPSPTTLVTSGPPVPAAGPPQPCPDSVITLAATVEHPSYRVGERPVFTLHIVNAGPVACVRDVSRQLRVLLVVPVGGTTPLWSSGDCYSSGGAETPVLRPGQELVYTLIWSGRTSAPGCAPAGGLVPAGEYAVIGKLGALASAPTTFSLH